MRNRHQRRYVKLLRDFLYQPPARERLRRVVGKKGDHNHLVLSPPIEPPPGFMGSWD